MGAWFRWLKEIYLGRRILGQTTERATAVLTGGTNDLYTISGGRILVTQILGELTIVMQGIASSIRLIATPGTGTARNMCASLLVNAYAEGDILGITGVNTDAMLPPASSSVIEAQTFGVIVQEGVISLWDNLANTGSIRWTLKWIPLDTGAAVVAA